MSSSSISLDSRPATLLSGPSTSKPQRKQGRKELIDDRLAVGLVVAKLSDQKAAVILTSTLKSAGCDAEKYNVSFSSIRPQRIQRRKKIAESLKSEFKPEVPLTVHWNGKMLEDITGHEVVDRLTVIVSGQGVELFLGVPKLPNGRGQVMASAVYEMLLSWGLDEKVKLMCFDTTASNTGRFNGACTLLEQKLEKKLLWLPCRLHILEIVLEAIVVSATNASRLPDIQIFKRLQNRWPKILKEDFRAATADPETLKQVADVNEKMTSFSESQLNEFQPRYD